MRYIQINLAFSSLFSSSSIILNVFYGFLKKFFYGFPQFI